MSFAAQMDFAAKDALQDVVYRNLQALAVATGQPMREILSANEFLVMNIRLNHARKMAAQDSNAIPMSEYVVFYHGYHNQVQTDAVDGSICGVPVTDVPVVLTTAADFLHHLETSAENGTVARIGHIPVPGIPVSGGSVVTLAPLLPENEVPAVVSENTDNAIVKAGDNIPDVSSIGFMESANRSTSPGASESLTGGLGVQKPSDDFASRNFSNQVIDVVDAGRRVNNNYAVPTGFERFDFNPSQYGAEPAPFSLLADHHGSSFADNHYQEEVGNEQSLPLKCYICQKPYKVIGYLQRHLANIHGVDL